VASERKILANRQNARRSTGPRTSGGKARARQNALRHGLAVTVLRDPHLLKEVKQLAQAIVGESSDSGNLVYAKTIAETELDLRRIRLARAEVMQRFTSLQCTPVTGASVSKLGSIASALLRIDRYERRALSRRKFAIQSLARSR
jgi:hypothetical protein